MFLVPLRVLPKKDVKMDDILKLFYHNNNEVKSSVLKQIQKSNGEGVCLILDGLDEYASEEEENNSLIFKLIHRKYLPLSMVMVVFRPVATVELKNKRGCTRVEVLGFLKEQIFEYIDNYPFSSHNSSNKLKEYLEKHVNILYMCYLPIHAGMVSYLHDSMIGGLPDTQTGIFTRFTLLCRMRLSNKDAFLESVDDLTGDENVLFQNLCELAFKMTSSSKQIFKRGELGVTTGSDEIFLGFVSVDRMAGNCGLPNLYTFVHLTLQEYLAAYHISKLDNEAQLRVISEHHEKNHMKVVWKFYCGLGSFTDQMPKFKGILSLSDDNLFHLSMFF